MEADFKLSSLKNSTADDSSFLISISSCCKSCQPPQKILPTDLDTPLNQLHTIRALEEELETVQNRAEQLEWTKVDLESSITLLTLSHARLQRLYSESLRKNAELAEKLQKPL